MPIILFVYTTTLCSSLKNENYRLIEKKSTLSTIWWKKRALMVWFIVMFSSINIGKGMFYKSLLKVLSTGDVCVKFGVL